jgi:RHS repeat-associated protein
MRVVQVGSAAPEAQYYTTDQRGAVVRLSDGAGRPLWTADYDDPYGQARISGPEAGNQPLRLAGQLHDDATGLGHHRFRVYDARTARFVSPDPLGLDGGSNGYGYPTDPVAWADPLGLTGTTANPSDINFTQRTVGPQVNQYTQDMQNGNWDWDRSGPLTVMDVDGQLVSHDNRRLMAAQNAQGVDSVPIQVVQPGDAYPASSTGRTWGEQFERRRNDPRNRRAGGVVPPEGVSDQPSVVDDNQGRRRRRRC